MKFDKYVAAGNDFIIFNKVDINHNKLALKVCDRRFGIGADGIMICEKSSIADIKMLYYNSDGSQGEMCGNGIRSFAKYIYDYNIVKKEKFTIETVDGIKYIEVDLDEKSRVDNIKVDMGYPSFQPNKIPIKSKKKKIIEEIINIGGKEILYSGILVGVPHVVIFVLDINRININNLGRKIENHPIFPRKTNVNFVEIINRKKIKNYTWERGAGRTLGCGTGSCASVVVGKMIGKLDKKVHVETEGGNLMVEIEEGYNIKMIGKAIHVARGDFFNL